MSSSYVQSNDFQVNDYLTLRLEGVVTNIYVKGVLFNQCNFTISLIVLNCFLNLTIFFFMLRLNTKSFFPYNLPLTNQRV